MQVRHPRGCALEDTEAAGRKEVDRLAAKHEVAMDTGRRLEGNLTQLQDRLKGATEANAALVAEVAAEKARVRMRLHPMTDGHHKSSGRQRVFVLCKT